MNIGGQKNNGNRNDNNHLCFRLVGGGFTFSLQIQSGTGYTYYNIERCFLDYERRKLLSTRVLSGYRLLDYFGC